MRVSVSVLRKLVGAVSLLSLLSLLSITSPATAQTVRTATAGTFTDARDGKTYRTVTIGRQVWMAENLNYRTANSWCYGNDDANCAKYGRLYTWNAALKACPVGWRLPTDDDWWELTEAVGGNDVAGTKLKSKTGWTKGRGYIPGTDEYGFSAMPGGGRGTDGSFLIVGTNGTWWTATDDGDGGAWGRGMHYGGEYVNRNDSDKSDGFSVRCLRE